MKVEPSFTINNNQLKIVKDIKIRPDILKLLGKNHREHFRILEWKIYLLYFLSKTLKVGAGETAQWLGALTDLSEDLDTIPNSHMAATILSVTPVAPI